MARAVDPDEDLIEVPCVAGAGAPHAQLVRVGLPELRAPGPDRLIADTSTPRSSIISCDVAEAQREPVIEPHAIGDDLGGYRVPLYDDAAAVTTADLARTPTRLPAADDSAVASKRDRRRCPPTASRRRPGGIGCGGAATDETGYGDYDGPKYECITASHVRVVAAMVLGCLVIRLTDILGSSDLLASCQHPLSGYPNCTRRIN